MSTTDKNDIKEAAFLCLERGMKTEKQLFDYLKKKGFPLSDIKPTIAMLKEYGYISDIKYAEVYSDIYKSQKGRRRIEYELKNKGLSEENINAALESKDFDSDSEAQRAYMLAYKRVKTTHITREEGIKLLRFLVYRGYSYEIASATVKKFLDGDYIDE